MSNFLNVAVILCLLGNLIIATNIAKYGFPEIGLMVMSKRKTMLFKGIFLVIVSFIIDPLFYNSTAFRNLGLFGAITIGAIPIIWIFVFRTLFFPRGQLYFNKAQARLRYWISAYYSPGKIYEEKGSNLREYSKYKKAIILFKKAIEGEHKIIRNIEKYSRTKQVLDNHYNNIGGAYHELAFLYRIGNCFSESYDMLDKSEQLNNYLLSEYPQNEYYILSKAHNTFRRAELNHILGRLITAKELYLLAENLYNRLNANQDLIVTSRMLDDVNYLIKESNM